MNSPDAIVRTTPARGRRARLAVLLGAAGVAALAGCGSSGSPAASGTTTPAATVTVTATGAPAATATATPAPAAAPSGAAPAAVPVLGRLAGAFAHGSGFGSVRPAEIFNGGDPTGLVTKITWQSWGGATATGTGTTTYVPANGPVADGRPETATVVAFNLGNCGGTYMYQAVEWYFPQHGQSFNPAQYENVCTGSFVGQ
jgi:hypothetical protein